MKLLLKITLLLLSIHTYSQAGLKITPAIQITKKKFLIITPEKNNMMELKIEGSSVKPKWLFDKNDLDISEGENGVYSIYFRSEKKESQIILEIGNEKSVLFIEKSDYKSSAHMAVRTYYGPYQYRTTLMKKVTPTKWSVNLLIDDGLNKFAFERGGLLLIDANADGELEESYSRDDLKKISFPNDFGLFSVTIDIEKNQYEVQQILNIRFICKDVHTNKAEEVFITGNIPELGNWRPEFAVKLNKVGTSKKYHTLLAGVKYQKDIQWKCLKKDNRRNVTWSQSKNKTIHVNKKSISLKSISLF